MKKISLLVAFLILQISFSQEIPFQLKKSEVFTDKYRNSTISDIIEDDNGGFILIRPYAGSMFNKKLGYYFEHYDADMKLLNDYDFPMNYSDVIKQSSVLGIQANEKEIHIIDFIYNNDEKAYICSANTAKFVDFQFTKKELFRLNSDEIKNFNFFSMFQSGFDKNSGALLIPNEDGTAFAISVDIKDNKNETHKIYLFDNNLNEKINHTFKRDIKDKHFRYENVVISDDGNTLFLLGKAYTDEKKKKSDGGKYQYELTRITSGESNTQVFDTDENFAASLKAVFVKDKLVCVGFYSEKRDTRYKGVSYFELDPQTLEIRKSKYNPFTEQFLIDKYGKDKDKELRNLRFRNLTVTPTNEIVFNGEEYYSVTHTMMNPNGGMTTRTTYHYNDIVSAKLGENGDLIWARNINKRQASGVPDYPFHSYSSTTKGDETFFFINTKERLKKLSKDRIQFNQASAKRSNVNVIRINPEGDFEHQEIVNHKDSEVPFHLSDGKVMLKNRDIVFFGRNGKKKQLIRVSL